MLEAELHSEKENHDKAVVAFTNEFAHLKSQQQLQEQNPEKTDQLISRINSLEVRKN